MVPLTFQFILCHLLLCFGTEQLLLRCERWNMRPTDLWCSCMIELNWKWKPCEDLYWPRRRTDLVSTRKPLFVTYPDRYHLCLFCRGSGTLNYKSMRRLLLFLALLSEEEEACRFISITLFIQQHPSFLPTGALLGIPGSSFILQVEMYDCLYGMHCTLLSPWGQKLTEIIEMVHSLDMTTVD